MAQLFLESWEQLWKLLPKFFNFCTVLRSLYEWLFGVCVVIIFNHTINRIDQQEAIVLVHAILGAAIFTHWSYQVAMKNSTYL